MKDNHGQNSGDSSLLELFKSEAKTNAGALYEILAKISEHPREPKLIEDAEQALRTISGGARIIENEPVEKLAQTLADCFNAAGRGEFAWTSESLEIMTQAVDYPTGSYRFRAIVEGCNADQNGGEQDGGMLKQGFNGLSRL